jgi:uncharacterized protein (TIGR03435 family)
MPPRLTSIKPLLVILWCGANFALAQGNLPAFEAASIKSAPASDLQRNVQKGGPGTTSPGQWSVSNADVHFLVGKAWDLKYLRVIGPASMDTTRYEIVAKLPADATKDQFRLMLRRLLMERIKLVVHAGHRVEDVFELRVAQAGPKLQPAAPPAEGGPKVLTFDKNTVPHLPPGRPDTRAISAPGGMFLLGTQQTTEQMAATFEPWAERPVVDKTSLAGVYDYSVAFVFQGRGGPTPPPDGVSASTPGETFLEAMERQLGLKFAPAKEDWAVLIVDSFLRVPVDN